MFKECGRRTDDGACLCFKLTYEPQGSSEVKTRNGECIHLQDFAAILQRETTFRREVIFLVFETFKI